MGVSIMSLLVSDFQIEKLSLETEKGDVLDSIPIVETQSEETNPIVETQSQETQSQEAKQVKKPLISYFFSNFSAKITFDMMANGSVGEVQSGLLFHSRGKPIDRLNEIYPLLIEFFTETGHAGGPRIKVSRTIWVHSSTQLKADFHSVVQSFFGAEIRHFDDAEKESVKTQVNGWLKDQAGGLLEDHFGSHAIRADTRLILASALKFEGEWFQPFHDAGVRDFTLLDGKKVQVPFMTSRGRHYVQQFKNFKMLSVPFKQHAASSFSMLFYLPDRIEDTEELRTHLGEFEDVIQKVYFPKKQVQVGSFFIPKFSLKIRGRLPLGDFAFDQMADCPAGLISRGGLLSSFIEINETGTRAAGGTAFFIDEKQPPARSKRSADPYEERVFEKTAYIDFVADRPIVFFIRDNRYGRMLFSGALVNPIGRSASFEPSDPEWLETIACQPEEDPEWLETIADHSEDESEWLETIAGHSTEE